MSTSYQQLLQEAYDQKRAGKKKQLQAAYDRELAEITGLEQAADRQARESATRRSTQARQDKAAWNEIQTAQGLTSGAQGQALLTMDNQLRGDLTAISQAMLRIRGSYAFAMMFRDFPDSLFVARKDSPLIIGQNGDGCYIASDVPAILDSTRTVYYIGNLEMAQLTAGAVHFYNIDREEIEKEPVQIQWDAESAEKGGYAHFMLKEIHEQPQAVRDTIQSYLNEQGEIDFSAASLDDAFLKQLERIYFVACGSA